MSLVLQICPDYYFTNLYKNLFLKLKNKDINQIVYVPGQRLYEDHQLEIDTLDKKYNIIERILFFGKQNNIYNDIISKSYFDKISIMHAHNLFSGGYVAYRIFRKYKIPYIVAIRNTDVNIFLKYMVHLRKMANKILESAENIIFISPTYKDKVLNTYINKSIIKNIQNKSLVIPNGIDEYFLKNLNVKKEINYNNRLRLIYVGEITKNKNIRTTIKACLKLIDQGYDVNFKIVGEIKESGLIRQINKYDFIHYYGKCPKEKVLTHLRDSDIFVMPSIHETFGMVYAEALSQGLPIIYTKGQGFDGFFTQGEVGYAVESNDYNSIAKYVIEIYENYETYSKNCLKEAIKFDWNNIAELYINLYK